DRRRAREGKAEREEDRGVGWTAARLARPVRAAARGPRPPARRGLLGRGLRRLPVPQVRRAADARRRRRALPPRAAGLPTARRLAPAPGELDPPRRRETRRLAK